MSGPSYNECSGGDGGMTALFRVGRPWPAAPHHGRSVLALGGCYEVNGYDRRC
jgi:hypothetical protein